MPGGFHPFHSGHLSLYNAAKKKFPEADVYVAATNDTSERPFPFKIKEKLAKLAGVDAGHFVQVKNPFRAEEITSKFNPNEDVLIFVRSEKDRNEQPKPGGTKKDGSPSYFQPYTGKDLVPFAQHAYMDYLPTIEFGPGITSASEIRAIWPKLNDKRKKAMTMSLYPSTVDNPKLLDVAVKLLDAGMGSEQLNELFDTQPDKQVKAKWKHDKSVGMETSDMYFTASNGVKYKLEIIHPDMAPDEIAPDELLDFQMSDDYYDSGRYVSFEQMGKGEYDGKMGIAGTGAAAEVFGIVVNAITQFIKKHMPTYLYFQAAEPSRIKLYARMIDRMVTAIPGYKSHHDGNGHFIIYQPVKKVTESLDYLEEK